MGDMFDYVKEEGWYDDDLGIPRKVQCKYCGKEGFTWLNTEAGWRLSDWHGNIHKCNGKQDA